MADAGEPHSDRQAARGRCEMIALHIFTTEDAVDTVEETKEVVVATAP